MENTRKTPDQHPVTANSNIADARSGNLRDGAHDHYDLAPVESALELEELVRLRAALTWADWKAHARFKKDRVLREAQRRWGVAPGEMPTIPEGLSSAVAANDVDPDADPEGALAEDPMFQSVCDARRDGWIEAMESEAMNDEAAETARRAGG